MGLRRVNHEHFIQAIKNGAVEKVQNIDSRRRPGLTFKALKDIYDSEDANRHASFMKDRVEVKVEDMEFDSDGGKIRRSCSVVEKKLKKRGIDSKRFDKIFENEAESDSDDINFGMITLNQLKRPRKVKRTKITHVHSATVKEEFADSVTEEDETDLNETISTWKIKRPKGKKKSPKKIAQTSSPVKTETILISESSPEFGEVGLCLPVKVEVSETECSLSEPMVTIPESCDYSVISIEQVLGSSGEACSKNVENDSESANQLSLTEKSETCAVNKVCHDHVEDTENGVIMEGPEITFPQLPNSSFSKDEESTVLTSVRGGGLAETMFTSSDQSCDLHTDTGNLVLEISSQENQISGVQEPATPTESIDMCDLEDDTYENKPLGVIMEGPEITFPQLPNSSFSKDEESTVLTSVPGGGLAETMFTSSDQSCDLHTDTGNLVLEISSQENQISGVQEPATTTESIDMCDLEDDTYENKPVDVESDSLSSPLENSCSALVSTHCSNCKITLVCEEDGLYTSQNPTVTSICTDTEREYSPERSSVLLHKVSTIDEGNQSLISPPENAVSDLQYGNQHFDSVSEDSVLETETRNLVGIRHSPERLLSTRKVISPTSQERLCRAMKGADLNEDVHHYKCKGKLQFDNATENEPSAKGKGAEITEVDTIPKVSGEPRRSKDTMRPRKNKKNSPPKMCSLPFSTGTKSLKKCSESAIAFSQRQMQDFESLATKLMQELNSMKDIVEGKLHPETSAIQTVKYDMDEVKMAVKSAKKAEETTKKWLSMMSRDCNRFCTIMKMTGQEEVPSPNETNKQGRKISFADEAGGVLCHVKVFKNDTAL